MLICVSRCESCNQCCLAVELDTQLMLIDCDSLQWVGNHYFTFSHESTFYGSSLDDSLAGSDCSHYAISYGSYSIIGRCPSNSIVRSYSRFYRNSQSGCLALDECQLLFVNLNAFYMTTKWFLHCQSFLSRNDSSVVCCRHGEGSNVVSCSSYQVTYVVEAQLINRTHVVSKALYILHSQFTSLIPCALKYHELVVVIWQYKVLLVIAECHSTVVATVDILHELIVVSRELTLLIEVVVASRCSIAIITTCIAESRHEESVVGEDRLTILVYKTCQVLTLAINCRWSSLPSLSNSAIGLTDIVDQDVTERRTEVLVVNNQLRLSTLFVDRDTCCRSTYVHAVVSEYTTTIACACEELCGLTWISRINHPDTTIRITEVCYE